MNGAAAIGGVAGPRTSPGIALNSSNERNPSLLVSSFSKSCLPSAGLAWILAFLPTSLRNSSGLSFPSLFLSPTLNAVSGSGWPAAYWTRARLAANRASAVIRRVMTASLCGWSLVQVRERLALN